MTQTPTLAKPTLASATKPEPAQPASPTPQAVPTPYVRPTAKPTRPKKRHWFLLFSFLFLVGGPGGLTGWYLWERAADQYASNVSFSVRSEEKSSAIELLGGITELSGSSSSDTDVLFAYLSSQELVRRVDARADLRGAWSAVSTEQDPIYAYDPTGTIEDLLEHWERKVSIVYDSGAGLIDVRVLAFDPERAKSIAQIILEECTAMINGLSDLAREDAIRYAREELLQAQDRLRDARLSLTQFRNRTQIVDPSIDTQNQMGLLVNLQQQLADALIEFDLLQDNTTRGDDPRVTQAERRIEVIRDRIDSERQNLGLGSGAESGVVFAELVGEYEGLIVDREFAEAAYTATLATHDAALAAARKQSRYLAAHVKPTLAEQAKFPERENILALVLIFGFLSWSVLCLIFYSLRDRS